MTTGEAAWLSASTQQSDAAGTAEVLKQVRDSAVELLAGLDGTPKSLRIRADQVELTLEWPEPQLVAPQQAVAPATAGHTLPPLLAVPPAADAGAAPGTHFITAGTVGTFYRAPEPGAKPFVEPGDMVRPGQQVGIIEAMKLMIPVEADKAGRVVDVLVPDANPVEFGDRLISLDTASG